MDGVAPEMGGVDDAGIGQHALFEANAPQQASLLTFGGMVFKVLAEVSLVAGLGNGFPNLGKFYKLHVTEFGYQFVVAFLGHVFHDRMNG